MVLDLLISMLYVYFVYDKKPGDINFSFFFTFLQTFFMEGSGMACFIFLSIKMYKIMYLREGEKQLLIKTNASAEMEFLKAQIHPHFLFNTLNNIYSYVINNKPEAPNLVSKLSDTMNYMIKDCDTSFVSLAQELKMITDYIELEKVRYGERLNIEVEITGETSDKKITPLLMIPFIENSFKHGASKLLKTPWIRLFIQVDEDVLHFTLINNKPPDETGKIKGGGIGLKNVKKRLELLYPEDHLLLIEQSVNTFTVNMQVPVFLLSETNTDDLAYAEQ